MSIEHAHDQHHASTKNILIAFFLNISFSIIEVIGGYLTNSVAIYTDALHDFGDSLALLFSYFAEKFSEKDPDAKFTYGYRRFSIFSALINSLVLFGGSIFVVIKAIDRINNPQVVEPKGMIVLAILGILVNAIAAFRLSKDSGLNQRMVMLHLLEDILGWVAVFFVSIVLLFKPWYILDSILSILIALIILRGVYKGFMSIANILLQKLPERINVNEIKAEVEKFKYVKDVHLVQGWSLDQTTHVLTLHVVVDGELQMKQVDQLRIQIKSYLEKHDVLHSTIQFESLTEENHH